MANAAADLGRALAVGVPRDEWACQAELSSQERADLGATLAERRQSAGRSSELDGERLGPYGGETVGGVHEAVRPTSRPEAERRRQRRLKQRPGHLQCLPVRVGEGGGSLYCPAEIARHETARPLRHKHEGAVEHVLARCTEVDRATVRRTDVLAEGGDKWDDRIAAETGCPPEDYRVEDDRPTSRGNVVSGTSC